MVGELFDILKADDAAVVPRDGGKAGRGLVNIKRADCLEADARPAGLECPGTHVVGAGYHGGRQQKGVLQRNAAQLRLKATLVLR